MQVDAKWEMIVVVGTSEDGTLRYAKDLEKTDFRVRVIEQQGIGIYDAMNIGLDAALGDFTWFMNAGDRFASSVTLAQSSMALLKSGLGVIIGGHQIDYSSGNHVYVSNNSQHRISAIEDLTLIEVQLGICDENDIIRFQDDYGRK